MSYLKVRNATRNIDLGQRIRVAQSLLARAIGLLGTPSLSSGEGLWLKPCACVHTFFMRYPIDILFLDADNQVLAAQTLPPWRFSRWVRWSRGVLELPSGTAKRTGTVVGDRLEMTGAN